MKPPSAGCHDLFGAAFNGSPSHLRVLKPPGGGSSDIFGSNGGTEQIQEIRSRNKSHQSSSLFVGSDEDHSVNTKGSSRPDGNPVTGEGYDAAPPKPPMSNSGTAPPTPNSSTGSAAPRQRVPPGGFSSGLW